MQQNNPFDFQQNQPEQMQQQMNTFNFQNQNQQLQQPQLQQPQNNMNNNPFNFQQMQPQNNMNMNNNINPFNFQQRQQPQNMNLNRNMNNNNNNQQRSFSRKTETKTKVRGANTNVIGLELGKLGEAVVVATGDAQYCEKCKSMFNSLSVLNKQEENTNSMDRKWKCEFCNHENTLIIDDEEIPKVDTIDYLLEPAPQMEEKTDDENTIIFVVDISGSMW